MTVMYVELSDEQQFLVEAAQGTLSRVDTLASARAALDGEPYLDLWDLAVDAGWPGLLSAEEHDGAGLGAYEAMLVLEACGRRLADARLLGHLTAAAMLEFHDGDQQLRQELAAGDRRAAFVDGADLVIDGAGADVLVAATPDGVHVVELTATPERAYDATRALARVDPQNGPAATLGRDFQRALLAAESVGAADACLTMAREYALQRYAFGRAIGSYQAIKHKLVEMLRRIEAARSLTIAAGRAWAAADHDEFGLLANAARVAAAEALDYAAPENIFIHGGIGATWEHDAQLYYRRAELSRRLCGGVDAAADDVAQRLFAKIHD
ncbi:MAG TPA: acyl-CoA dehydrogenase family protein [Solirubrobacteraceae bacterium]|jgi:alkylation response protein AidB-like acyl-CoA dehydrogenase|nr:acyl-CoA dehydrogenase family protein [Solirubrobacteraceae bacterium]